MNLTFASDAVQDGKVCMEVHYHIQTLKHVKKESFQIFICCRFM